MSEHEPEWFYPHKDDMPCDNRAVAVLVVLRTGEFYPDIGRYYGAKGWSLQAWSDSAVVAWTNLPAFKDHVQVVEVEQAA